MKKTLLSLGLLGLALQGQAQGYLPRWERVNLVNAVTPPDYVVEYLNTVSSDLVWGTMYDRTASGSTTAAGMRSIAGTNGTQFEFFPITSPVAGHSGYLTSNIVGITDQIAITSNFGTNGGGEILRTRDGGLTWRAASTATQFAAPDGFNNLVHMFNATEGVAFGDPNGGSYEVLTTSDGGATWTRNTSTGLTPTVAGEAGLTRAFATVGNTIWVSAGVQGSGSTPGGISRIFKNINKGQGAWTAVTVPNFPGPASDLAFYDADHGMIMNYIIGGATGATYVAGVNIATTTDGGATWNVSAISTPVNGQNGKFYITGLDAAQGKFISYGRYRFGQGVTLAAADFGYSYSTDGRNWTDVQTGCPFTAMDVMDANAQGFAGYVTDANNNDGGIFKTVTPGTGSWQWALGTRQNNSAVQQALSVYPNPSADGVFTMNLKSGLKAGTQVVVFDAVGRQVYSRELNATAVSSQKASIDLSQQKAGIYTLELRTAEGTAQQKLVVQ
jgi:hypothetical protein